MLNCFSWENMAKNSIRALIFFLLSNSALAEINIPNVSELEMTGRINIDTDYFDGLFREDSNNSIMKVGISPMSKWASSRSLSVSRE